ncbi:MAG: alpha/beta fold hydrolase [Burkholderiales bacterium]
MPHLTTDDGVKLWYEETGSGTPVVFAHEFAGDARSWEPQIRHFSRRYRCVAYNARGYPPSDVPEDVDRYSQARVCDDIRCVLDHLKIERAHVVGLSMGSFATLHFAMAHGARALSATVAGCGYGAHPATRAAFVANAEANAKDILDKGMAWFASTYGHGPARMQLKKKDELSFNEYIARLSAHSAEGSANTMRGYQARRPSLYDLTAEMAKIAVPVLIVNGDEDEACLEPGLMMKRTIPKAGHMVFPWTGHAMNLEEPALFNRVLEDFFHQVESGRW